MENSGFILLISLVVQTKLLPICLLYHLGKRICTQEYRLSCNPFKHLWPTLLRGGFEIILGAKTLLLLIGTIMNLSAFISLSEVSAFLKVLLCNL